MILHITDSMKILTSEKGSPDDLQGSFVIISVILFSLMFNTSNTFNQNSVSMYLFLDLYIQKKQSILEIFNKHRLHSNILPMGIIFIYGYIDRFHIFTYLFQEN